MSDNHQAMWPVRMGKWLWRPFSGLSMRKKLLVSYLAIAVIPIVLIGIISYIRSSDTIIRQTRSYASLVLEQLNRDIDAYIDKNVRIAYITYSNVDFQRILEFNHTADFITRQENRDKMNQFVMGINTLDGNIDGVYIYTVFDEMYFRNSAGAISEHYSFRSEPWFEDVMNGRVRTVLLPVHEEQKHPGIGSARNFSYVIGVTDIYTNQTVGFIQIDMNEKVIRSIVSLAEKKLEGQIVMLDARRSVVYDSDGAAFGIPFERYLQRNGGSRQIVMENASAYTGWNIAFIAPLNALRHDVDAVRNFTVAVALLCILAFTVLSTVISKSISRPVNRLKQAIELVESGDMEISVEVESRDEIGKLSHSFNRMVINIRRLIREVYEIQLKKRDAELSALQSQINPHFMYNTLESISMMAVLDGNLEISDTLSAFANILRYNLDNKKHVLSLSKELDYVGDYIRIQKLRFKERFDVVFSVQEGAGACRIQKLTLQPLVENAIKHACTDPSRKVTIRVEITRGDLLRIVVADDGAGMSPERLEDVRKSLEMEEALHKEGSIGLNNIHERIRLYDGAGYGLKISSEEGRGTCVILEIPAEEAEESDVQRRDRG